jgi:signal transduction histidine kinase
MDAGPLTVAADASQVRQVVMNLVINAAEAIGDTPGEIELAVEHRPSRSADDVMAYVAPDAPPGPYITLSVTDTGAGIDPQNLDRIFEPFFSTKFTGRGLGLAAVLGIVRGHRAALHVASRPGQGTTFTIFFPALVEGSRLNMEGST